MKTKTKTKALSTLWITAGMIAAAPFYSISAIAETRPPSTIRTLSGQEGNGGAGLERDGRYMTFYSAGLYTEPFPVVDNEEIPGLIALLNFFRTFPHIAQQSRLEFIGAALPSKGHQYFKVKEDRFDDATLQRLIAEYESVTGQPRDQIRLFAITDTNRKNTFLLPSFYRLTLQEQMAILFHETYWILKPRENYQRVVDAEVAFQAVLAKPDKMNRVLELLKHFGNAGDRLMAMAQYDLANGTLDGLVDGNGTLPITSLFGKDFFSCLEKSNFQGTSCFKLISLNLYLLSQKYPKSLLIPYLSSRSDYIGMTKRYGYDPGWVNTRLFCTGKTGPLDPSFEPDFSRCESRGRYPSEPVIARHYHSFWGNNAEIDYSDCALNLSQGRGYSKDEAYLPIECGHSTYYDHWLSSVE